MTSRRPQDLVFTLYGDYLLTRDQPTWVGSLIALLRPFKVSEGAVRTVLSRMVRKGWLVSRRSGRNAYYGLTARGRRIVEEGGERVRRPPQGRKWDGRWCLVTYSVPEDVRHLRDRLRVRLSWMGFGSLGNGVWICPHDIHGDVEELAEELGLVGSLVCFNATQLGQADADALVARCWDLPALTDRYQDFLTRWRPESDCCRAGMETGTLKPKHAYLRRFELIYEYKRFPLDDPFLPDALLPSEWPGKEAALLFNSLHDLLEDPAASHVSAVLTHEPRLRRRSRTVTA